MNHPADAIRAACTARLLIDSPLGPILLARTQRGLASAWFVAPQDAPAAQDAGDPLLARAAAQLARYFAHGDAAFDVPLDLIGTPFQQRVWHALLEIPAGRTCSYSDVAQRVGAPRAVRAVGASVGRNPVAVIVPCHRVVGRNGAMTGYAGGLERKAALLAREGIRVGATRDARVASATQQALFAPLA